ncbi:N/A [soil metagenome]
MRASVGLTIVWAIAVNAVCILPSFLVGVLQQSIAADFALPPASVGAAVAGFWLVAAVGAVPCSRLVRRRGALWALRVAGIAAAIMGFAIGFASQSTLTFVVLMSVAGVVPALATPALNVITMSAVSFGRQAFALTAAGASPVFSLTLAGLLGPALGSLVGWRGVFAAVAVSSVVLVLLSLWLPRAANDGPAPVRTDGRATNSLRPLVIMMVGVGAGNLAVGAATSFLVVAAPHSGVSVIDAAVAVAVASAVSVLFRLMLAALADRRRADPILWVGVLLAFGAAGFVVLSFGSPATFYVGLVLVLIPGWSWVSFLLYTVLARYRRAVAAASGIVQMVFFAGGVIGPLGIGLVVGASSFSVAWWLLAAADCVAAASVFFWRRRLPAFISL